MFLENNVTADSRVQTPKT